jgi:molybdate transport system substrate-binding protein
MQKTHGVMHKDLALREKQARPVPKWQRRDCVLVSLLMAGWPQAQARRDPAQSILKLAAASDLRVALPGILQQFTQQTGVQMQVSYGSSGQFARQIQQGLPVHVFMSADQHWVRQLEQAALTQGEPRTYATGRLAWITLKGRVDPQANPSMALQSQLQQLKQAQGKLAIAHPEHAPYGRASVQLLQKFGAWETIKPYLIYGDNVAQAMQFASTGAAWAAITALPLVSGTGKDFKGHVLVLDPQGHEPLIQQMVTLKNAPLTAGLFMAHMQTPAVRQQLRAHGFALPEPATP